MADTTTPMPAIGSHYWQDQISPETDATVLSLGDDRELLWLQGEKDAIINKWTFTHALRSFRAQK